MQSPTPYWQGGFLLLDKPQGITSTACLGRLKAHFSLRDQGIKIGHGGTLDPFANGLLIVALSRATRLLDTCLKDDKIYEATLRLGQSTPSLDTETAVNQEIAIPPLNEAMIEAVLTQYLGEQMQIPPIFSAVKYQGKPLYHYARKNQTIPEKPPRAILLHRLDLIRFESPNLCFRVHCSKGTYVRTLGESIAKSLGTLGHLTALRRLQSGRFKQADAHPLEKILQQAPAELEAWVIPTKEILASHMPLLTLSQDDCHALLSGRVLAFPEGFEPSSLGDLGVCDPQGMLRFIAHRVFLDQSAGLKLLKNLSPPDDF